MADGFVQAPPDAGGKQADATELTVNGQTVERLRVSVPDPVRVTGDWFELIWRELRLTNELLAQGLGVDIEQAELLEE